MTTPHADWVKSDRRAPSSDLITIMGHVRQEIHRLEVQIHTLTQSVTSWMEKADTHSPPCKHLTDAVPDGDIDGHREYHEGTLEWSKRLAQIKWAVVTAVAVTGTVGFLAWLGVLIWMGALKGPAG